VKSLDLYLRDQRISKAKPFINDGDLLLDIGCGDGALLESVRGIIGYGIGVDPVITCVKETDQYKLLPGTFPTCVPKDTRYDIITMLAVLEHFPPDEQAKLAAHFHRLLKPKGRVIITVPSPRVDEILHVLIFLRMIDGMSAHEHYGFKVEQTEDIFDAGRFRLLHKQKFQLGLNNLFVFERTQDEVS
jgi:2-polyprenyl-3-methyl-5-hydroxy-6-metoxy-1,4-benzoquinol methylase